MSLLLLLSSLLLCTLIAVGLAALPNSSLLLDEDGVESLSSSSVDVDLDNFFCQTDFDCEYLGECDIISGKCQCWDEFQGPTCATMKLQPAVSRYGVWPLSKTQHNIRINTTAYSWGFSALAQKITKNSYEGRIKYKYHAYVNVGCYFCENGMVDGTVIAYVTSDKSPEGPYEFQHVILSQVAFNPHALQLASGTIAIFYRRKPSDGNAICLGGDEDDDVTTIKTEPVVADGMYVATADSPNATESEWTSTQILIKGLEGYHISNPSAIEIIGGDEDTNNIHNKPANSVLLALRVNTNIGERVALATGPTLTGPYEFLSWVPGLGEDPFLWQDNTTGVLHIYYHVEDQRARSYWPSLHAFSIDGGRIWNVSRSLDGKGAYPASFEYISSSSSPSTGSTNIHGNTGGSRRNVSEISETRGNVELCRRERPDVLFHPETGKPWYLFTGVQLAASTKLPQCKWAYSFSLAQGFYSRGSYSLLSNDSERIVANEAVTSTS